MKKIKSRVIQLGKRAVLSALLVLGLAVPNASADSILVTLVSITGAGPYTWTYDATLSLSSEIKPGDFFSIFDFGTVLGHSEPLGWAFSNPATTTFPSPPAPGTVSPLDNPFISNLKWTYVGPPANPLQDSDGDGSLEVFTGLFSAVSPDNVTKLDGYGAQDHAEDNVAFIGGQEQTNFGTTVVPTNVDLVPEPGSMILLGTGLFSLAGAARRRVAKNRISAKA